MHPYHPGKEHFFCAHDYRLRGFFFVHEVLVPKLLEQTALICRYPLFTCPCGLAEILGVSGCRDRGVR